MTAKEYLQRAYYLDRRIESDLEELSAIRKMAYAVNSPGFEEHYNASQATDAPFVKNIEKIAEIEIAINAEIDKLIDLKSDIREIINEVANHDQQMVLRYRYILFYSWDEIASAMHFSRRWLTTLHKDGLDSVEIILQKRGII